MNAVNAVLLFILVWTFTAVCQADDKHFSVSCDNVTGFVGTEVKLTCSVSVMETGCCIRMYKFKYPESYKDSTICRQELPYDPCVQRNSFTCRYSSTTAMTEPFRFFVSTTCGTNTTAFTVSVTESSHIKDKEPEDDEAKENKPEDGPIDAIIPTVVGLSIIIILILIIILMTIICKKQSCGFQKRKFLCSRRDDDNSNHPEDVI